MIINILKVLFFTLLFILLTILTQIGGVVLFLSFVLSRGIENRKRLKLSFIFLVLYLLSTFLVVPHIASYFGRERIIQTDIIKPTFFLTNLLNRNYVKPKINSILRKTELGLKNTGTEIRYLDANFPFIDNFPLLPHLSHNDGKKIDISLVYTKPNGELTNDKKSNSGYGVFAEPEKGEIDQIKNCRTKGYFQYDYPKYLTFGGKNENLVFSIKYTKLLINAFLSNKDISKIFIEPHLKVRLNLKDTRVRYHGCKAVRHDDHIHIQIK